MADKTPGYFPKYSIRRKLKAKGIHPDSDATEHDSWLWDAQSAHGGAKRLRQEFLDDLAKAHKRFELGYLGELGFMDEKQHIVEDYDAKLKKYRPAEEAGRKYEQRLRSELTTRPTIKSTDMDQAVERGFQGNRTIAPYEALPPDKQRDAIRIALDKKDFNFLSTLMSETPALISGETAQRVEIALMRGGDHKKFEQLEELVGKFNYDGTPDPLGGALTALSYAIDSTKQWFREQAGLDAKPPQPKIEDGTVILSLDEAKSPAAYRTARGAAEADGLEIKIVEK